nr:motile sperm domain-containing protein 2-like [Lytechinus pictus]
MRGEEKMAGAATSTDETRQKIEENKENIEELRRKFFEENAQDDPEFDARDLDWIRSSDAYMYHVLLIGKMNLDIALDKLTRILKWRKEYGVNDLTFDSFPEDLQQMGGLYSHATDKNGHRILWYRVKHYQKGPENQMWAKKMTVYWLNKLQKEDPENRIVVLEDMTGGGVSNMDIDLIRFKIQCFELYFPALVEMLYIYDMPWILNTLWKIVEKILSQQAREHIKFIRGKEVQTYIAPKSLPAHMGGTDPYEWVYVPEDHEVKDVGEEMEEDDEEKNGDASFRSLDGDGDPSLLPIVNAARSLRQSRQPKKVHFQDDVDGKENVDPDHSSSGRKIQRKLGSHRRKPKIMEAHAGPLVTIRPGELLVFTPPASISGSEGISASLTITNTTDKKVAYKMKITTPERYKVRPSMGPINPGSSIHISITLLSGPGEYAVRDKFLIMSSDPGDASFKTTSEITYFWKNVKTENVVEHRMSCIFNPLKSSKGEPSHPTDKNMQNVLNKLKSMEEQMSELRSQNSRMIWLQSLLFFIIVLVFLYIFIFKTNEGAVLTPAPPSPCSEATEKFLRGAREGL